MKCEDVIAIMEKLAPIELAEQWDNSGFCIGDKNQQIKRIVISLDVIDSVIEEAIALKADMIITHHPLILFQKIKSITSDTPLGNRIIKLIQNHISVYSAHTNLDIAFGGTNDTLAELAGLQDIKILEETLHTEKNSFGIGRIGQLSQETKFGSFAEFFKKKIGLDSMRIVGDSSKTIRKVAICTGSGFDYMKTAKQQGADVFITADIKFHEAQKAVENNICLIDATHYASEVIIVSVLKEYIEKEALKSGFDIQVFCSKVDGQTFQNI